MKYGQKRTDLRFMVIIGTFGDQAWLQQAYDTAVPSAIVAMGGDMERIFVSHGGCLSDARNTPGLIYGTSVADWIVFLDADDQLDKDYISAMQKRIEALPEGDYIIQPATVAIRDGVQVGVPGLIPPRGKTIMDGNHCVIGSAVPARLFFEVGGFDEWPAWEDWALWIKCWKNGAKFTSCPEAIYKVGIDTSKKSRNEIEPRVAKKLFKQIRDYYEEPK